MFWNRYSLYSDHIPGCLSPEAFNIQPELDELAGVPGLQELNEVTQGIRVNQELLQQKKK
jgi:hypothetical protein